MGRKRWTIGAAFKVRETLAALRGEKSASQLAKEFGLHMVQTTILQKQLLDQAAELFELGRRKRREGFSANEQELYARIGQLRMEVESLKECCLERSLPSN